LVLLHSFGYVKPNWIVQLKVCKNSYITSAKIILN